MARSTGEDAQALFHSLLSAYAATPKNLKIIDLYVGFAVFTALIQAMLISDFGIIGNAFALISSCDFFVKEKDDVAYMAMVGSFPFNSFLSGVLSCVGTAVLAVCLRIQVNKENKEFKSVLMLISFSAIWCFTW